MNKYVIYVKPSEELEERLKQVQEIIKPHTTKLTTHFHGTLLVVRSQNPDYLCEQLEKIQHSPIFAQPSNYDAFGKNDLVLRLNSEGMKSLHKKVLESLRDIYEQQPSTPYVGENYNPHITIADGNPKTIKDIPFIRLCAFHANEFIISEKNGGWKEIAKYELKIKN